MPGGRKRTGRRHQSLQMPPARWMRRGRSWGLGYERDITGDAAADRVVRLVYAAAEAAPPPHREVIADGDQPLFFTVAEISARCELTCDRAALALRHLDDHGWLRIEHRNGGVHVWLRAKVRNAA